VVLEAGTNINKVVVVTVLMDMADLAAAVVLTVAAAGALLVFLW
jgi:hypothetical protein